MSGTGNVRKAIKVILWIVLGLTLVVILATILKVFGPVISGVIAAVGGLLGFGGKAIVKKIGREVDEEMDGIAAYGHDAVADDSGKRARDRWFRRKKRT